MGIFFLRYNIKIDMLFRKIRFFIDLIVNKIIKIKFCILW